VTTPRRGHIYRHGSRLARHRRRLWASLWVWAYRRHHHGRLGWRARVSSDDWALPLAVRRDFPADALSVHVLCLTVLVWWARPGER
jgi:hypothetical protein